MFYKKKIIFFHLSVCVCVRVFMNLSTHECCCLQRPEEDVVSHGTGIIDRCELLETELDFSAKKQQGLLTVEPSLQLHDRIFKDIYCLVKHFYIKLMANKSNILLSQ